MKMLRTLVLAAPLGILAACSGGSSSGTSAATPATPAELAAATPSISGIGLADGPVDAAPSDVAPAPGPLDFMSQVDDDACNPHLFIRSEEVVDRVNRHFYKFLVHVEDAIASHPASTSDWSATWNVTRRGVDAVLTVNKTGDTSYTWTLELSPVQTPAVSAQVAYGAIDTAGATTAHQGKGSINVDLTALATVTREEVAGTIAATFESFPGYKLTKVEATDVVWDTDSRNPVRAAPRSSSYVSYRQAGVGGSLVFQEEELVPTACPTDRFSKVMPMHGMDPVSAPSTTSADVELVNRWYLVAPATTATTAPVGLHGRSDAQVVTASGAGVAPSGIAKLEALTCHSADFTWETPFEGAWLLKAEDSTGKTLWGREFVVGATPCDPELGATVPSLDSSANDFNFAGVNFTVPYTGFPKGAYPPP